MNQVRFATLLYVESQFPPHLDHAQLIAPASCLLESELDRLVATPGLSVVDRLIAALRASKKNQGQAETLERWAAGEVPTMLGIITNVLLALRRGIEQQSDPIRQFLAARFSPVYLDLLQGKHLDPCLNRINSGYRIPACHGLKVFDAAAYAEFARLMIANQQFQAWNASGPDPRPAGANAGILHHHLVHAVSANPEPGAAVAIPSPALDPLARLMGLRASAASPLSVKVEVEHVLSPRDVSTGPPNQVRPFVLGDRIRFSIWTNRSCHLTLIDAGTSGGVTVLRPNACCRDMWIEGGQTHDLPDLEDPESTYELTGQPGQERVIAIATFEPLQAISFLPEPGAAFRVLEPGDLHRLVDHLESGPTGWAVEILEFRIEGQS
jgi:hypothetical protein